jgi:hypothetical protein
MHQAGALKTRQCVGDGQLVAEVAGDLRVRPRVLVLVVQQQVEDRGVGQVVVGRGGRLVSVSAFGDAGRLTSDAAGVVPGGRRADS